MSSLKYAKETNEGSQRTKARVSRSKRKYQDAMCYLEFSCKGLKDDFEESENLD